VPFDFILIDWKMPGALDGIATLQRLHRLRAQGVLTDTSIPALIISAYSQEGLCEYGALFSAFLSKPVTRRTLLDAMAHARAEQQFPGQQPTDERPIPRLDDRAILLAEDNSLNREIATELLHKTGARIIVARNGREAIETVAQQPVDLVLMDLQMPVMDGFEAGRRIRAQSPELPILALSAAVMEDDRARAREAGMNDHLAKPIDKQSLFRLLETWLPAQQEATTDTGPATPSPTTPASGRLPRDDLQRTPAAAGASLPTALEGFHLQRGLDRFDQDAALYLKLLQRFRHQLEDEFAVLSEQLLQQPRATATKRLINTLKGLANTLGAERLAAVATEIDKLCDHGAPIPTAAQTELTQALNQARAQLAALSSSTLSVASDGSPHDPPSSGTSELATNRTRQVDPRADRKTIEQMLQALVAGELIEEDLMDAVTAIIRQHADPDMAVELQARIDAFDHDRATELLEQVAARIADPYHEA
jgi:CheY-like chemotaxis protein